MNEGECIDRKDNCASWRLQNDCQLKATKIVGVDWPVMRAVQYACSTLAIISRQNWLHWEGSRTAQRPKKWQTWWWQEERGNECLLREVAVMVTDSAGSSVSSWLHGRSYCLLVEGRQKVHKQDADWWRKETASECWSAQFDCAFKCLLGEDGQTATVCTFAPTDDQRKRAQEWGENEPVSPFVCSSPRTTSSGSIYISLFQCPFPLTFQQ